MIYPDAFQLYKPNKEGTGGSFSLSYSPTGLFVKIAKQIGTERKFDWPSATIIKLGLADIASILAGIQQQGKIELFHDAGKFAGAKNPVQKGLNIQFNEQYGNFYWSLWRKEGENTISAGVNITAGETAIIASLLRWVLPYMLRWDIVKAKEDGEDGGNYSNNNEEVSVDEPFPSGPMKYENTKLDPLLSAADEVFGAPQSMEEKVAEILKLAKTKLGAVSAEDAKKKVMEHTGKAFIAANIDSILSAMRG